MRNFCYVDKDISDEQVKEWKLEFKSFIKQHLGITPSFHIERWNFDTYPTYKDSDNDLRPTASYLKSLTNHVEETYGDSAFDHVFVFIAKKNWRSGGDLYRKLIGDPNARGIWGTNYSMVYGNLHLHYCRWDERNMVNTLWTSLHEGVIGHPADSLCKVETGVNLNIKAEAWLRVNYRDNHEVISYLNKNGFNWDRDHVHGAMPELHYLGRSTGYPYEENVELVEAMSPYLRAAYDKRRETQLKRLKGERDNLLRIYLGLLRRKLAILLNRKNGVPRNI